MLSSHSDWPFWAIFAPLWVWKFIATLGATVGAFVWCRYPHYRLEGDSYAQFKAMLISLALHLILLMFELLACDRLTLGRHLWVLVFIPLIFGSVVSVGACVWSVKHDRSFELELFLAVNALQFVFLPLKLDGLVSWSWEVVFVPLWIVLCLSLVGKMQLIVLVRSTPCLNTRVCSFFRRSIQHHLLWHPHANARSVSAAKEISGEFGHRQLGNSASDSGVSSGSILKIH